MALPSSRWMLLGTAAAAWGAVGAALVSQFYFDMQPCPWCTLQRLIFLLIGALCVMAALLPRAWGRKALAWLATLLAACGVAAALWQHRVAALDTMGCAQTLADKILSKLGLFDLAPDIFAPTASCAEASVDLLGVPYALWSLALFAVLGLTTTSLALRRHG
ncbi:MAG: disulfide bond formation protein B [Ideonella sp. MAG2]|nr:MAG: disulfide bond formation protein B [Ideonella sp. MAG2]